MPFFFLNTEESQEIKGFVYTTAGSRRRKWLQLLLLMAFSAEDRERNRCIKEGSRLTGLYVRERKKERESPILVAAAADADGI